VVNIDVGPDASSSDIQAVARVGQICGLFGPQTSELSAVEIAERIGLNRTTAYRYCVSMVSAGILDRGPRRGTFVLGGMMLELGILALGRRRVVEIAPPFLADLSATVQVTSVLGLWGARGPVAALVHEDTSRMMVVTVHTGSQLEAFAAQTLVFLAYRGDPRSFEMVAAPLSPSQRVELQDAVATVVKKGFATVKHEGGLFAVAVPVFDEYGIAATVALLGADQMADYSDGSPLMKKLIATAEALGNELKGRSTAQVTGL